MIIITLLKTNVKFSGRKNILDSRPHELCFRNLHYSVIPLVRLICMIGLLIASVFFHSPFTMQLGLSPFWMQRILFRMTS